MLSKQIPPNKAYWIGAMMGPLAVFPASLFIGMYGWFTGLEASLVEIFFMALAKSVFGIVIAYIFMLVYGGIVWWTLRSIGLLGFPALAICSVVPAVVYGLSANESGLVLFFSFYSLSVCGVFWYFVLRYMRRAQSKNRTDWV